MPKLYYPTPDELQGAVPLNENTWMREYQELMLALANTSEGKDLLCIEDYGLPIIGIRKNAVCYDLGGNQLMADFRVGAKWGNVVRYRWQEIKRALNRMNLEILLALPNYFIHEGRVHPMMRGAATLPTVYPDAHPESTSVDGQVCRDTGYPGAGTSVSFATMHNGAGTSVSDTGTNGYYQIYPTSTTNEYFNFCRCIYGFDTSAMGPSTTDGATASFVGNGWAEGLGRSDVALAGANPTTNTALIAGDFQRVLFTTFAPSLTPASTWLDGSSSGTYSNFTLNSTGLDYIESGGVTNFGVMLEWDRANSFGGTWASEQVTHQGSLMSDNTGTSKDPKLVVTYTPIPFVSRSMMF